MSIASSLHCFMRRLDLTTERIAGIISSELVHHYTAVPALYSALGIDRNGQYIKSWGWNSIYATRTTFLNDSKEVAQGREIMTSFIAECPDARVRVELEQALRLTQEFDCYVASFSSAPDQLEQWRSYGDDGKGVSVAFNRSQLSESHVSGWVVYDPVHQRSLLQEYANLVAYWLDRNKDGGEHTHHARRLLAESLMAVLALIKHEAFRYEREFRVIKLIKNNELPGHNPVEFRISGSAIIPYLKLYRWDHTRASLPWSVMEVIAGPGVSDEQARALQDFVDDRTNSVAWLKRSVIPYVPPR